MIRMIIYGIGVITTAFIIAVSLISAAGWGKGMYDKRKQSKVEKQTTASKSEAAA